MPESKGTRTNGQAGGPLLRAFDLVIEVGAALAAVLLLAVMLATIVKIVFRYGLGEGLIGVDQISGTMLLYITFLGAAWVLRREEHVTIDLVLGALAPGTQRHLHILSSVLGVLVCLALTLFGTLEVVTSWQKGIRIPAEIELPRAINLAVIPLGCFCLAMQFLRRAWHGLRDGGPAAGPPLRPE